VAADAVNDALFVGGAVGVADRRVGLGAQHSDAIREEAAEHDEAEGTEEVDLIGGKHVASVSPPGR
jgi:hypothetical protein